MNDADVLDLVKTTVEDLNSELGFDHLSNVTSDSDLFGGPSGVDSLSLVRIIAEVERAVGERFGRPVVLADERAMSRRNSPYRTVGTIAELVRERLAE